MPTNNRLTLAVAGSRKTQSIVDDCSSAPASEQILILTYTENNQAELKRRLASKMGNHPNIRVMGWFAFLIEHFAKPYLPYKFPDVRIEGFDFVSDPKRYKKSQCVERYFNENREVCRVHLPQLVDGIEEASNGAGISCIERLYHRIYIDEVQDLCGYDLEILKRLMASTTALYMVGDVRQAVLATNQREPKNKTYQFMKIWNWFQSEATAGRLAITHNSKTWRCRQEIATFADQLFDPSYGFHQTVSVNTNTTNHDGFYLVKTADVEPYVRTFSPLCLRYNKDSGKNLMMDFTNYRASKGLEATHVLILPTAAVLDYLTAQASLTESQASTLYVAVTRAKQSVAFIVDNPGQSKFPYWPTPAVTHGGHQGTLDL